VQLQDAFFAELRVADGGAEQLQQVALGVAILSEDDQAAVAPVA
jgi:hypothetical protein